jgi:hypothetical protein
MADAEQHHRQTEAQLNAFARRVFPPGSYHIDWAHIAALGGGNLETGEHILEQMFKTVGPRTIHPHALRELGNGNAAIGRRVMEKFLDRLYVDKQGNRRKRYAKGGEVKLRKADAGYRNAIEDGQFCALCSNFAEPAGCSLVQGKISRTSLCDHYDRRQRVAA